MRQVKRILGIVSICIVAFIIGMFIGFIRIQVINSKSEREFMVHREFEIFQGYSYVSGGYNDTSIKVIVNERDYDTESMFEKIRDFHNKLNGEPDELEISLYNSKEDFRNHKCIGSKTYYKE